MKSKIYFFVLLGLFIYNSAHAQLLPLESFPIPTQKVILSSPDLKEFLGIEKTTVNNLTDDYRLLYVLFDDYNAVTGGLEKNDSTIYLYDDDNQLTTTKNYDWDGEMYELQSKVETVYNAQGLATEGTRLLWENDNWQPFTRSITTYTANNLWAESTSQDWVDDEWVNKGRFVFDFDAEFRLTSTTQQNWVDNEWVNTYRILLGYDSEGRSITNIQDLWIDNDWFPAGRTTYGGFNALDTFTNSIIESWNNEWYVTGRDTVTYNLNGNRTWHQVQNYNTDAEVFENVSQSFYQYDGNYNLIERTFELVDAMINDWFVNGLWQYVYDDENLLLVEAYYGSNSDNVLELRSQRENTYELISNTDAVQSSKQRLFVFPNPAENEINISLEGASSAKSLLSIYSLDGNLLHQETLNSADNHKIEVNHLSKGFYLLELKNSESIQVQKILIQK